MKSGEKILLNLTIGVFLLFFNNVFILSQNVSVNNDQISTTGENSSNVIILETPVEEKSPVEKSPGEKTPGDITKGSENSETSEINRFLQEELAGGTWVLSGTDAKKLNSVNITKWNVTGNEINAVCSWKDKIEIIHTVESGFKWQDAPKTMKPGEYLNMEAIYTNIDYSTTANLSTGVKMFFTRIGSDLKNPDPGSIEVLKLNKDNKQYNNEVKKGFFYAPKTLFDASKMCQLVVDCYIGKDHYITTYTYTYQP